MHGFHNDEEWKGKWERQLRQTQERLQDLVGLNERRLKELEQSMDEVRALQALIRLYREMIRRGDQPP
ncbi:MAG: hypothetical protein U0176_25755 [Bacteroidia bacterium]